jgi:nucleoside-diphosphate-sugar epimerase
MEGHANMKVFLTGGSGYIGRAVTTELIGQGHSVRALARSAQAQTVVEKVGAGAVPGGLTDLDVLTTAAASADAVIHLAQADSGDADLAAATAMQDGVGAGTYVHTGGTWVYGDTDGVVDETAPWKPPSLVAWRQPVEAEILDRANRGGRPVIVQPGLLYGGDNRLINEFFTVPGERAGAVAYIGDGTNHWALVHVDDLADLYVRALQAKPGSVYVGVAGPNPSAKDAATAISHRVGLGGKTVSITLAEAREQMGPIADAFALDQQLTSSRAQSELGWTPSHTDPLVVLSRD